MQELEGMKFPDTAEEMMGLVIGMPPEQRVAMLMEMVWHSYHPDRMHPIQVVNKAYQSAALISEFVHG